MFFAPRRAVRCPGPRRPPTVAPPAAPVASALPVGEPDLVEAARNYLSRPYSFGGQDSDLDYMGLVFLSWEDAGRGHWDRLSANPTELVSERRLGTPVLGLNGVANSGVSLGRFAPGDVIFSSVTRRTPPNPRSRRSTASPPCVAHGDGRGG